jgi:arsenite-transporting ATPase
MSHIDVDAVDTVDDESDTKPVESEDTTVDVEVVDAVTDLPDTVDAPEYVLYGGKGGVGKTTMAASTALASAAAGTETLVISTDPAHSLSDTLNVDVPADPIRVDESYPLYAVEIDPDSLTEGPFGGDTGPTDIDSEHSPFEGVGDGAAMGEEMPFGDLGGIEELIGGAMGPNSMPGADEAAAMQQLLRYIDDQRYERVIIDTAPTGHTLRLLQLPEVMDSMLGRIAKMKQQFSGLMGSVKGMFGAESVDEGAVDLDELRERIERLRSVLQDPTKTDFRVVMIPEEMSVIESERLVDRLNSYGIPVQTLIINRVMENLDEVTTASVDDRWVVSPDLDSCEFCQRRWDVQQQAIQRATDLFRGRSIKRVPLLAEEVRGEDALRVVARCLE